MFRLFLVLIFSLFATTAFADTEAAKSSPSEQGSKTCTEWTLCDGEDTTGVCATTDEIVANVRGFTKFTMCSEQSTATTFTCQLFGNKVGHDAGTGQQFTETGVTQTQVCTHYEAPLQNAWASCNPITGGVVTVSLWGCL